MTSHKTYFEQDFLRMGAIRSKPYEISARCFNYERAAYVAAGPYSSIVVTQSGLVYAMGFCTAIGLTQPTYRMAACGCPATNKFPRQHCEDRNGHVTKSKRGPLAFGPVFGCPLDREQAQDHHQTPVGERFMAPGQLYTPDKHGRRMLVATKCLSSAQTCSYVLPRVLAFLMGTKTSLCHNKESLLPRIPPEVWR